MPKNEAPALKGQEWIDEDKLNGVTSRLNEPWFNSAARLRTLDRQGKLTPPILPYVSSNIAGNTATGLGQYLLRNI